MQKYTTQAYFTGRPWRQEADKKQEIQPERSRSEREEGRRESEVIHINERITSRAD